VAHGTVVFCVVVSAKIGKLKAEPRLFWSIRNTSAERVTVWAWPEKTVISPNITTKPQRFKKWIWVIILEGLFVLKLTSISFRTPWRKNKSV